MYVDSTVVGVMNSITSLYAGFAVFSMTGFLAQQTNRPVESVSFPRRKMKLNNIISKVKAKNSDRTEINFFTTFYFVETPFVSFCDISKV